MLNFFGFHPFRHTNHLFTLQKIFLRIKIIFHLNRQQYWNNLSGTKLTEPFCWHSAPYLSGNNILCWSAVAICFFYKYISYFITVPLNSNGHCFTFCFYFHAADCCQYSIDLIQNELIEIYLKSRLYLVCISLEWFSLSALHLYLTTCSLFSVMKLFLAADNDF